MAHDQYCDKDDVKNRIGLSGTSQDNNIDNAINGASRQIDAYCGRVFYKTESAIAKSLTHSIHSILNLMI